MGASTPTRVDDELYAAAQAVGDVMSRSAAQQISHWARLGREMETSGALDVAEVTRVLAGAGSYDDLGPREQAAVRVAWNEQTESALDDLDLETELSAAGQSWSEADADGATVRREPRARRTRSSGR